MKKNDSFTKAELVRELAEMTDLPQKQIRRVLGTLRIIAFREAKHGSFTIPDICRIDVVSRKEHRARNPRTGQGLLIAAHDVPRIRMMKRAKDAICPMTGRLVYPLDADGHVISPAPPAATDTASAAAAVAPTTAPEPPKAANTPPASATSTPKPTAAAPATPAQAENKEPDLEDFSKAISFRCPDCGGEIEAPAAAAGLESECPVCGKKLTIPAVSEPGTIDAPPAPPATEVVIDTKAAEATEAALKEAQKKKTIRIDLASLGGPDQSVAPKKERLVSFFCKQCHAELEATSDMMGTKSECPRCGASFEVPFFSEKGTHTGSDLEEQEQDAETAKRQLSQTIRIEMADF